MAPFAVLPTLAAMLLALSLCDSPAFAQVVPPRSQTSPAAQVEAVKGLIERKLGDEWSDRFQLSVSAPAGANSMFTLAPGTEPGTVSLHGDSGVSLASGLYHYLRTYCNASVTWGINGTGNQLPGPVLSRPGAVLPAPAVTRMEAPTSIRWYLNSPTTVYTMAWWGMAEWLDEVDWMALHGVTSHLASMAMESVEMAVYTKLGLTEADMFAYFPGPGFISFNRCGNLRGPFAGPLSTAWLDQRKAIQSAVLARARSFGMTPTLPAFSGKLPCSIVRALPGINISYVRWAVFNATCLLQPSDPHFATIATLFLRTQQEMFGTDHLYEADQFVEMVPSCSGVPACQTYLTSLSRNLVQSMVTVDPAAVWVVQSWAFNSVALFRSHPELVGTYLDGGGPDRVIVIDLEADTSPVWKWTQTFYNHSFIWAMLHNFGQKTGIYGNLSAIASQPIIQRSAAGSAMIGTGITMEGTHQNPIMYELMTEMGWRSEHFDLPAWRDRYVASRYGLCTDDTAEAWRLLTSVEEQGAYASPADLSAQQQVYRTTFRTSSAAAGDFGLYWSASLNDTFVTTTDCAGCAGLYSPDGASPDQGRPPSGAGVAMYEYYNPGCKGHDTVAITAAAADNLDLEAKGYERVGRDGMVSASPGTGLVPLKLLYSEEFCDYASLSDEKALDAYLRRNYTVVCTLGYLRQGPGSSGHLPAMPLPTYNATTMARVWGSLQAFGAELQDHVEGGTDGLSRGPFEYDLVDVARQVLDALVWDCVRVMEAAVHRRDIPSARAARDAFFTLLADFDGLLSSNANFLLGNWLLTARARASTPAEADLWEYNARNQITIWGFSASHGIHDYARKQWGGMIRYFYGVRWNITLAAAFADLRAEPGVGQAHLPTGAASSSVADFEDAWQREAYNASRYPGQPVGDTILLSAAAHSKYAGAPDPSVWALRPGPCVTSSSDATLTGQETWTRHNGSMAWLCSSDPACIAFTPNGWLLRSVSNATGPCQVYVRNQ